MYTWFADTQGAKVQKINPFFRGKTLLGCVQHTTVFGLCFALPQLKGLRQCAKKSHNANIVSLLHGRNGSK